MKGTITAKEFHTVKVIPHLENETGEYDYAPTYEVRIDKGGKEESSTARRICLEWPPIEIIEKIEAIGAFGHPYVSDFVDISHIVNLCRRDIRDAYRILRQLDGSGSVVFEVTAVYLLTSQLIQYHPLKEKGNTMAGVTFTEKELGFIDECAIDKKGVLVEMPANPFPSLYRKGVIAKKGDALTVTKDFRDMFCLDGQVVHIDLTKTEGEPEDGDKKFKYGETGDVIIGDAPVDYAGFRQAIAANLRDRRTKGIDEFQLIDKAVQVYDAAREVRAANGDEGTRSEHTTVGSRKHWRYALADVVSAFFGVGTAVDKREIVFTGDLYMAGAAELVFEYLFKIGNRRAQRSYDERLFAGEPTVGVYAEKAAEFMAEVEKRLQHEGTSIEVDGEVVGEVVVDLDHVDDIECGEVTDDR